MTQDEMIKMYLEVSNKLCNGTEWCWAGVGEPLQLFAKLVAQHEREACAKLCFEMWEKWMDADLSERDNLPRDAEDCANAIRARGQA
jgi:hypothetical protein